MYFDERDNMVNIEDKNWDNDFKVDTINIINFNRSNSKDMYSSNEGFNKGNMFKELYYPYKNYVYKIAVNGRRDELLLRIQELTFKIIDLGLYLDINPDDSEVYSSYKVTLEELKKNKELYEKNYGPLCEMGSIYYDDYKWLSDPWPWMKEGLR